MKIKLLWSQRPCTALPFEVKLQAVNFLGGFFSLIFSCYSLLGDPGICQILLVKAMADSDGEYVADDLSDDDIEAHHIAGAGGHGTRSSGQARGPIGSVTRGGDRESGGNRRKAAWEDIQRSWDTVVEGADGSINSTVEGLREAVKRKRSAKLLDSIYSV